MERDRRSTRSAAVIITGLHRLLIALEWPLDLTAPELGSDAHACGYCCDVDPGFVYCRAPRHGVALR